MKLGYRCRGQAAFTARCIPGLSIHDVPTRATGNVLFVRNHACAHDPCRRVALRARLIGFEALAAVATSDAAFGIAPATTLGANHCICRDGNTDHKEEDEEEDARKCSVHER